MSDSKFNQDKFTWHPGDIVIRDEIGDESEFDESDYSEKNGAGVKRTEQAEHRQIAKRRKIMEWKK